MRKAHPSGETWDLVLTGQVAWGKGPAPLHSVSPSVVRVSEPAVFAALGTVSPLCCYCSYHGHYAGPGPGLGCSRKHKVSWESSCTSPFWDLECTAWTPQNPLHSPRMGRSQAPGSLVCQSERPSAQLSNL